MITNAYSHQITKNLSSKKYTSHARNRSGNVHSVSNESFLLTKVSTNSHHESHFIKETSPIHCPSPSTKYDVEAEEYNEWFYDEATWRMYYRITTSKMHRAREYSQRNLPIENYLKSARSTAGENHAKEVGTRGNDNDEIFVLEI